MRSETTSEEREIVSRRGERGSSYVIALLALFVLTILGLALVVLTQNEVQIGANERTINRVFYAAEAGAALSVAKTLTSGDYSANTAVFMETHPGATANNVASVAKSTEMIPTALTYCSFCPTDAGSTQYYKITHVLNVTTDVLSWVGGTTPPANATNLGEKTIGMIIEVEPLQRPDPSAAISNALKSDLTKVMF
jgi:Tfp pilus assembly protein PilX